MFLGRLSYNCFPEENFAKQTILIVFADLNEKYEKELMQIYSFKVALLKLHI